MFTVINHLVIISMSTKREKVMKQSETIVKLSEALSKAQSEMGGAVKDSKNPFFKSSYADLTSVIKSIKEPFANNGLAFVQFPINGDKAVGVVTRLMHSSGEWLESEYTLPLVKNDPQSAGSAITYARRYALSAMVGIPAVDDDAELAMVRSTGITTEQAEEISKMITDSKSDVFKFLKVFKVEQVADLSAQQYEQAHKMLAKKLSA